MKQNAKYYAHAFVGVPINDPLFKIPLYLIAVPDLLSGTTIQFQICNLELNGRDLQSPTYDLRLTTYD
jgi:hypothetical protein